MPNAAGLLLVLSGPSGVGKTTIVHGVREQLDVVFSVSATTRPQTATEREGVDYHFMTVEQFIERRDAGEMLEWAEVFGNFYGTPRGPVEQSLARGKLVVLDVDVQGARQVKEKLPDALAVFILPPDEDTLLTRLRGRRRDDEATIKRRFARAKEEMAQAKQSGTYDEFIINDDLAVAIEQVVSLVRERMAVS